MSISDNIALFDSKIDKTYWTEQVVNNHTIALLSDENYYKVLQKPYVKVGENSGTSTRYHTNNFAEYFANRRTEDTVAVVNSVKTEDSIPTKISIATYYAYFDARENMGKIAILNRFDQTGPAHENHLDVYGFDETSDEFAFYKKYMADIVISDAGKEKYQVKLPHMHFNTRTQSINFRHHDKANAISIEKLMEYIKDLKAEMNPTALINNLDMGMPFLDLKNSRLTYSSTMLGALQNVISYFETEQRVKPDKFSDYERETVKIMKSLINIDPDAFASGSPSSSGGPVVGPVSGPISGGPAGTPVIGFVSSASAGGSAPTSRLQEYDFRYIIEQLPPLDGLTVVELNEVKSYISKFVRQLDKDEKEQYDRRDDRFYPRNRDFDMKEYRQMYKSYLKYIKGMINLESIRKDLKKYMMIYEVLNERDNVLMSVVSKELLKNLTLNIKVPSDMEKGGVNYDPTVKQPH